MSLPARHPGRILQEEYLEPLGLSACDLARAIQVDENSINDLLSAQRHCSGDFALRLATAFKTRPQFWLGLQNHWDLYQASRTMGTESIAVLV
jgi:addiction module HigA family antidote